MIMNNILLRVISNILVSVVCIVCLILFFKWLIFDPVENEHNIRKSQEEWARQHCKPDGYTGGIRLYRCDDGQQYILQDMPKPNEK